jgi:GNAT superfamily N-acetyltransferase
METQVEVSLYARYAAERCGHSVLEIPEGFATYTVDAEAGTVYILDLYVIPAARRHGYGTRIADRICAEAREHGCTKLFGSIDPATHGAHASMLGLLAYGMTVSHLHGDLIFFAKDL